MKEILGTKVYTVAEAADILGIKPATVRVRIRQGRLKCFTLESTRQIYVSETAIQDFLRGTSFVPYKDRNAGKGVGQ